MKSQLGSFPRKMRARADFVCWHKCHSSKCVCFCAHRLFALATSFFTLFCGLYLFSPNTTPWFRILCSAMVVLVNVGFLLHVTYTLRSKVKDASAMLKVKMFTRKSIHAPSSKALEINPFTRESLGVPSTTKAIEMIQQEPEMHKNYLFDDSTQSANTAPTGDASML